MRHVYIMITLFYCYFVLEYTNHQSSCLKSVESYTDNTAILLEPTSIQIVYKRRTTNRHAPYF